MQKLFLILLLAATSCGDCAKPAFYQVKQISADPSETWKCHYVVDGLSTCATWQKTPQVAFADSCGKFVLSEKISAQVVNSYK